MKIMSVVGARPNFMKVAPFIAALEAHNRKGGAQVRHVLVHTGQHFDVNMSDAFFVDLGIPAPDHHLGIGSGSHAYQVGMTMIAFETVLLSESPDWVVVLGDVNATCACSLTAKKHGVRVAHVEAGLRSNDWSMPEEINRVVTDRLADLLFTTCRFADANLEREGALPERIARVGNIMIDTLEARRSVAAARDVEAVLRAHALGNGHHPRPPGGEGFGIVTLHRPSNVDEREALGRMTSLILELAERLPLVFPVHPRTMGRLKEFGLWAALAESPRLVLTSPLGYLDFLCLTLSARLALTDSGGLQEECCVVGTPCLTLRQNTERPATLVENGGTNRLAGTDPDRIRAAFSEALTVGRRASRPPLWDGHTAERIVERLLAAS